MVLQIKLLLFTLGFRLQFTIQIQLVTVISCVMMRDLRDVTISFYQRVFLRTNDT